MSHFPVRQCVILLEPTELHGETGTPPHALMQCGDRPFLAWLMREMQRFGIEDFVLLATEQSVLHFETAVELIRSRLPKPANITLLTAPHQAGSGGMLHHARQHLQECFLFCDGEVLFSGNLARFLTHAGQGNWALLRADDSDDQESLACAGEDDEKVVPSLLTTQHNYPAAFEKSGIFLFDHSIFQYLTAACSLEQDVLAALVKDDVLKGLSLPGDVWNVRRPENRAKAKTHLPTTLLRPAVFLDRDGVINHDHGWVGTCDRFEWEPDVLKTIAKITDSGHHVFIVTNQSGIARGFYTEDHLEQLMSWVIDTIREHGGTVDDWRYCPMHPEAVVGRYRGQSPNRKPSPGMILDLSSRWELDPARCVMFGDQTSDIQAAEAAGIEGIRVGPQLLSELASQMSAFQ
ncbi:HAD-IIIA family hydrolase [Gluconobacter cerinus]|nr:HAD-IIIA family hydrolase [Gluconobacter cerinus]